MSSACIKRDSSFPLDTKPGGIIAFVGSDYTGRMNLQKNESRL
jgi:hypothetical protein